MMESQNSNRRSATAKMPCAEQPYVQRIKTQIRRTPNVSMLTSLGAGLAMGVVIGTLLDNHEKRSHGWIRSYADEWSNHLARSIRRTLADRG